MRWEEAGLSRSAAQAFAVPEGAGEQALLKLHSPGFHERVAGDNARLYASAEWAGFNRGLMVGLIAAGRRLRRSSG